MTAPFYIIEPAELQGRWIRVREDGDLRTCFVLASAPVYTEGSTFDSVTAPIPGRVSLALRASHHNPGYVGSDTVSSTAAGFALADDTEVSSWIAEKAAVDKKYYRAGYTEPLLGFFIPAVACFIFGLLSLVNFMAGSPLDYGFLCLSGLTASVVATPHLCGWLGRLTPALRVQQEEEYARYAKCAVDQSRLLIAA